MVCHSIEMWFMFFSSEQIKHVTANKLFLLEISGKHLTEIRNMLYSTQWVYISSQYVEIPLYSGHYQIVISGWTITIKHKPAIVLLPVHHTCTVNFYSLFAACEALKCLNICCVWSITAATVSVAPSRDRRPPVYKTPPPTVTPHYPDLHSVALKSVPTAFVSNHISWCWTHL